MASTKKQTFDFYLIRRWDGSCCYNTLPPDTLHEQIIARYRVTVRSMAISKYYREHAVSKADQSLQEHLK